MRLPAPRALLLPVVIVGAAASGLSAAGTLDDFERDATRQSQTPAPVVPPGNFQDDDDDCDSIAECLMQGLAGSLFSSTDTANAAPATTAPGLTGSAAMPAFLAPTLRIDAGYQAAGDDVTAADIRGETGYRAFALQARHTRYREENPDDTLALVQVHALYRIALGESFGIAMGIGTARLDGNGSTSGTSLTLPVRWRINDRFGLEWTPAHCTFNGNDVNDNEVTLSAGAGKFAATIGYRQLKSPGSDISGPRAGISFSF